MTNKAINPLDFMIVIKAIKQDDGNIIPVGTKLKVVKKLPRTVLGDDIYVLSTDFGNIIAEYGIDVVIDPDALPLEVDYDRREDFDDGDEEDDDGDSD